MSESKTSVKGFDNSLTDRFRKLNSEKNKPDAKEFNPGSPVSTLTGHRRRSTSSGITPATSSSSSGSSGSLSGTKTNRTTPVKTSSSSDNRNGSNNNSGELSVCSENSPTTSETLRSSPTSNVRTSSKHGHLRSYSGNVPPLIYSGGGGIATSSSSNSSGGGGGGGGGGASSCVNSPINNNTFLPTGNICPSGKIVTTGMSCKNSSRNVVLGSGSGNYGHGSIMRGGGGGGAVGKSSSSGGGDFNKKVMTSLDPEEVKRAGNEEYNKGHFMEALNLYDRAISISPGNASFHSNRAAALTGLGRLVEAIKEYEEAVRLDPGYGRAHQRLASLHLRFGQVDNARKHLTVPGQQSDPSKLQNLQEVEKHLTKCANARKIGDWKSVLREGDAAIAAGVDSSHQLFACRTEALLKLHQLEEAETSLSKIPDKIERSPVSCSQSKFFGMLAESYIYFVRAQIELAFGRFENAVAAAEKACQIDPRSIEVTLMLKNVKLVAKARSLGNDLFKAGNFIEACSAYGDGLKIDPSNSVLYCNRAACWLKLGQWEKSVEDCNQTLRFQPKYTKALLRRASSNDKLQRWVESVRDYEVLRRELPGDKEVAEALFHAQVSLKKSRGEEIHNLKFGGEVEDIYDPDQLRAAISSPSVSVVYFVAPSDQQCEQMSPYVNSLCSRYPSVNFLKVDIKESPALAKEENVIVVPAFKIYKSGKRIKEMICPIYQLLEQAVRQYSM
ncbi:hypothetical protein C5167_011363 [Papaver somniferum]|uniref:Thioredoxin domain-containing protein n=1 Tax=Papaver somniferum TaxID=3469 RepID=A0A4Y7K2W3_PAPSO|nr:TPR repeat-containing thioredoxin TTL1-like [Papaver somniferum]RZC67684.1 hypothetical protein C5167_011363 [Papaver somniferum]